MGISPGWRDIYGSAVAFQWVDVSDVQPGTYWLAASSDPNNAVVESNETNNGAAFAASATTIPGFVAQPVSVSGAAIGQPTQVTLTAASVGMRHLPRSSRSSAARLTELSVRRSANHSIGRS